MGKLYKHEADLGPPEVSENWPSDFRVATLTTGTVDDDDDPARERSGENEAAVREKNENTYAIGEFRHSEQDRDSPDE